MKLNKLTTGNYSGWYKKHFIFLYRRPHGKWCVRVKNYKEWIWGEGYFGTSLPTVKRAMKLTKMRIDLFSDVKNKVL